jgi:hypothetical protein
MKNYEFYDIFKKTCSYENGVGECKKTRESKKCVDDKCETVKIPESKLDVLQDYYSQIKQQQEGGGSPEPVNKALYNYVKQLANKKFKSPSGIYRSSWIVKEYKRRGGKYSGKKTSSSGLKRWFKEKWVDLNRPIRNSKGKIVGYKSCGRKSANSKGKYPLCRPSKRINKGTPKTYHSISKSSLKKAKREKSRIKSKGNIKFGGSGKSCGSDQDGGYYGDKYLKKKLIKNLKKRECPICHHIIKGDTTEHLEKHANEQNLPHKKRKLSLKFYYDKVAKQDGGCGDMCMPGGGKIRSQFKGTRSKVMVTVPLNVKNVALYAYKLKKLGFGGGLETGWKRAKQLSTKESIPIEDLKYMLAWFARHIYASYPSYKKWKDAGRPKDKLWHHKHGIISWIIWGADAAFKWVNSQKNINLLNKHYPGKNYKPMKLKN